MANGVKVTYVPKGGGRIDLDYSKRDTQRWALVHEAGHYACAVERGCRDVEILFLSEEGKFQTGYTL